MFRLETFYQSKEFRGVVDTLKHERQHSDGLLYCEHCGEPIIKKYDCIAHHKIELTQENVNDASISLDGDNIMLIHYRCHNKIHERFGYQVKRVYVVYGSPCSGKSTFIEKAAGRNDIIIDHDKLFESISNNNRYVKPDSIKHVVFKLHSTLIDMVKTRFGKWSNAWIVGGYPMASERERMVQVLGAELIFIDEAKEVCKSNRINSKKPDEWDKYIDKWFERFTP